MNCQRCAKEFLESELKPPSLLLRLLAFPFFAMFVFRTRALRNEMMSHYCRHCRRQLNFCLFFAAFMFVTMGTWMLLLQLGIIVPAQQPR